ncbi:hypothetical protein BKA80DRAFT_259370 [Phyllosticta citrichinensis]
MLCSLFASSFVSSSSFSPSRSHSIILFSFHTTTRTQFPHSPVVHQSSFVSTLSFYSYSLEDLVASLSHPTTNPPPQSFPSRPTSSPDAVLHALPPSLLPFPLHPAPPPPPSKARHSFLPTALSPSRPRRASPASSTTARKSARRPAGLRPWMTPPPLLRTQLPCLAAAGGFSRACVRTYVVGCVVVGAG